MMILNLAFLVFGVLAFFSGIVIIYDSIKKRQGLKYSISAAFMIPVGIVVVGAAFNSMI